jgi:hypothetical protein
MKTETGPAMVGFEERLLPLLRERVLQRKSRRGRRRRSVLLVAAAAVLVIATGSLGGRLVGRGERMRVDALEALEDPDAVVADLRTAGIDARIFSVPIGRGGNYRPGVWVDVGYDNPDPTTQGAWFETWWGRRVLSIPKEIEGTVSLFVGRDVIEGESPAPAFLGNELGPTGDFWCLALETMRPLDATVRLENLGYEVEWEWALPINDQGIGEAEMIDEIPETAVLIRAGHVNRPNVIRFQLMDERFAEEERQSWGAPSKSFPRSTWESWAPPCD